MEMRMYLREAFGVRFADLPSTAGLGNEAISAEFYGQLFHAKKALDSPDTEWRDNKRQLGEDIARKYLMPWRERANRTPRILATGAGEAVAEGVWIDLGMDVTIHDGTTENVPVLKQRYPTAKFLIEDMATMRPNSRYDIVSMLANDFVLGRNQLRDFVRRISESLVPGGLLICSCPNILSLRRIGIELLRRSLGYYRKGGWVFWGWWRTPSEFVRVGAENGLELVSSEIGAAAMAAHIVPPLKSNNGLFCFKKPC